MMAMSSGGEWESVARQICGLLQKQKILRMRRWPWTLCELLLPLVFIFLLAVLRSLTSTGIVPLAFVSPRVLHACPCKGRILWTCLWASFICHRFYDRDNLRVSLSTLRFASSRTLVSQDVKSCELFASLSFSSNAFGRTLQRVKQQSLGYSELSMHAPK